MNEIKASFFDEYYRIVLGNSETLYDIYCDNCVISRIKGVEKETFTKSDFPIRDFSPFESKSTKVKCYSQDISTHEGYYIINTFGSYEANSIQKFFSQEFVLKCISSKWYIENDIFFTYESGSSKLCGAEINGNDLSAQKSETNAPTSNPYLNVNGFTFRQNSQSFSRNQAPSSYDYDRGYSPRKAKPENLDPRKSITIIDLPSNYNGNEITSVFDKFGRINRRFFTHHKVYIEFDTPEIKNLAINNPPVTSFGFSLKIEDGVYKDRFN